MLKLTKKVEYALISLAHMSNQKKNNLSSASNIAEKYLIPSEVLAKLLQQLAACDVIESVKGPLGGYRLKTDIHLINIVDLIEKVEGPIGLMDCAFPMGCDQIDCCTIKKPLTKINETIINTLKQITLDQIR